MCFAMTFLDNEHAWIEPGPWTYNPECRCSGLTTYVNGYVLGECNAQAPFRGRNGGWFYCYVHIHQNNRHCCQDYSIRFSRYCVNYGLCDHPGTPNFMPMAHSQTASEVASDF